MRLLKIDQYQFKPVEPFPALGLTVKTLPGVTLSPTGLLSLRPIRNSPHLSNGYRPKSWSDKAFFTVWYSISRQTAATSWLSAWSLWPELFMPAPGLIRPHAKDPVSTAFSIKKYI